MKRATVTVLLLPAGQAPVASRGGVTAIDPSDDSSPTIA
jgi:hypothetical protein